MPLFNVENGCASGSSAVHLGVNYIRAGAAHCVLAIGHEKMAGADKAAPDRAIEASGDIDEIAARKASLGPAGETRSVFMDYYAEKLRGYCEDSGASARHLAMIAAENHRNGARNANAQSRDFQTVDDVLAARVVVDPLTVLMCSPIFDGAAALVIASPEWARAQRLEGPEIAASVVRTDSFSNAGFQTAGAARVTYQPAGIEPQDRDIAEVHDATAADELIGYEAIGLAACDEGWRLVESGDVALGGRVPVDPSGGLIARGHPLGATGVAQFCEPAW